jgi:hypothetical protein
MDDGGVEVALGAVAGEFDIVAMPEDGEADAVGPVALLEASGFGLRRHRRVEHQAIGGVLSGRPTSYEGLGCDLIAHGAGGVARPKMCRSSTAQSRSPPVSASAAKVTGFTEARLRRSRA